MEKSQKQQNKNHNNKNKRRHQYNPHNNHQNHREQHAPMWTIEKTPRVIELPETKADLMQILEGVNPEELTMTSLVQQSKALKNLALKKQTEPNETEGTDTDQIDSNKVKIDLGQTCPICEKPIREIMYALHDYDHDRLAHFDCVFRKVTASVKEKLTDGRYLAYLGSGSFGIMQPAKGKNPLTLIEKIYPGAPLEELLHGDEQEIDEQL